MTQGRNVHGTNVTQFPIFCKKLPGESAGFVLGGGRREFLTNLP